ncbi:M15 family metallopeptidase [Sporosarcina aquimarina]|uniref:M15 family metallopeptidase n=1 Tax=Sporosarcina aquimarina TaxID=114975 RepID=A0ABU4FZK9_9BACL|nr:M15 family metallopeptidase [Sporosarcina aquimarina]MDW0110148.1 M15 family metallopeptidase [Sporosarcina aquimarina]
MKKRRQDRYRPKKNKSKGITAVLLLIAAVMIGLVIWVSTNDWSVEKTLIQVGLGDLLQTKSEENQASEGEPEPETEPSPDADIDSTDKPSEETPDSSELPSEETSEGVFDGGYVEGQKLPKEPTYVNNILVANKKHPLPESFAPGESKEARAAFDEMAAEAALSGFNLTAFSTYRSYDYQVTLYNRYADRDGKEAADRYSARPGYSEHQTGLAFDIGEQNHEKHWASSSFGETEAGKWLLANAHRYGFILRYPENKEEITGYMHEAWHFRFVGKSISDEIFKKNITLEEYLGLE